MPRSAIVFVVLTVAIPAALYFGGPARLYAALQTEGMRARGVVVTSSCSKHVEYLYSFTATGRSYTGTGSASPDQCPRFKPGAMVPVAYLPGNPAQNFDGDPTAAYNDYLIVTALISLLAPGLITIALHVVRPTPRSAV